MASEDPYYNRHLKGTKVYAMRHRIVLGALAAGGLFGVLFTLLPSSKHLAHRIQARESTEPQIMKERRIRISHGLPGTAETIKERVKVIEDPPII